MSPAGNPACPAGESGPISVTSTPVVAGFFIAALTACIADAGYVLFQLDPRRAPLAVPRLGEAGGNFLALPVGRMAVS